MHYYYSLPGNCGPVQMFPGTDKGVIKLEQRGDFLKILFRYFKMIGETMAESQTPMEKLVDNMEKRKIADYFQDCLCTKNNHGLCNLIMSKFYQLSGFTKSIWKSERLKYRNEIDHFAVTVFQGLLLFTITFS